MYSDLQIRDFQTLEPAPTKLEEMAEQLKKLIVVKLNGGLGTSMGCKGPKSIIPVRHDLTFLDLTMQQIEVVMTGRRSKCRSSLDGIKFLAVKSQIQR